MKQLTQEIFKNASDWVRSAAVDSNGSVYYYSVPVSGLTLDSDECWWLYRNAEGTAYCDYINDGFNTNNWKNSAIDREK